MKNRDQNLFGWREYAAFCIGGMIRNRFFRINDSGAIEQHRNQFNNTDIFASICRYAESDRDGLFISPMFFDLDAHDDLEQARADTLGLCQLLEERARVPHDCLGLFFSGSKGFHIEVACNVFRPEPLSHMLQLYKRMALKAVDAGLKTLDTGIYTSGRLWRLSNSVNSKKNRYKIPLTFEELRDLNADKIAELAQRPRGDDSFALSQFCQATADWYRKAISVLEKESKTPSAQHPVHLNFRHGWRMVPCVKAIEEATLPDGKRHELYISLSQYYAFLNMHPDEIMERIVKIDHRNPIRDPDSIGRTIAWACEHQGFAGCSNTIFKAYCKKEDCFYAHLKNHNNPNKKGEAL